MSSSFKDRLAAEPDGRLDRWVVRCGNVLSVLFLVAVVISISEVISRYAFGSPTAWVHESTILIVGLCLMYGGAYCLAKNEHIRITLLYEALPPRYRRLADFFNVTVVLVYMGMLAAAAWVMSRKAWFTPRGEFRLETTGSAWNSVSPAILKGFLLLVVILMTVQAILHLVRLIRKRGD